MMDDRHVCNELFLCAVANQYALDFKKLKMCVLDVFTCEEQKNIDPDGDFLHSTQHFDCFVEEHEIKEVNVGTVVLYLKGVKLVVSHQAALKQSDELLGLVLTATSTMLAGLFYYFLKTNSCL